MKRGREGVMWEERGEGSGGESLGGSEEEVWRMYVK